jgi:hypothetical protein
MLRFREHITGYKQAVAKLPKAKAVIVDYGDKGEYRFVAKLTYFTGKTSMRYFNVRDDVEAFVKDMRP